MGNSNNKLSSTEKHTTENTEIKTKQNKPKIDLNSSFNDLKREITSQIKQQIPSQTYKIPLSFITLQIVDKLIKNNELASLNISENIENECSICFNTFNNINKTKV